MLYRPRPARRAETLKNLVAFAFVAAFVYALVLEGLLTIAEQARPILDRIEAPAHALDARP